MGSNLLLKALQENDAARGKKARGYFENSEYLHSFPTGIPIVDYNLGYMRYVYNTNSNEVIDSYPCLGIPAGSLVTVIGKPSTAKTTTLLRYAANIVRGFDSGSIIHWDVEQSTTSFTRVINVTGFKASEIENDKKYILRQDKLNLNDMKNSVFEIYNEKMKNKEKYEYDTGLKNEFGKPLIMLQPTVIILDSFGSITSENEDMNLEKFVEVSSQTERMRLTAEIGRCLNEIIPCLKGANIILLSVNQIKQKIAANSFIHSPSEILYLNQDETLPSGKMPQYLAAVLMKHTVPGSGKLTLEDDGIDGFTINVSIIKSRVSAAGANFSMIYDKDTGISMLRTCVNYAKDIGVLNGNRGGYYFGDEKNHKFTAKTMEQDFYEDRELYRIMHRHIIPPLQKNLEIINPHFMDPPEEELNFYNL